MKINLEMLLGDALGIAILLSPLALIAILLILGRGIHFLLFYYLRIKGAKNISECPDIVIPPEVITLINRFDPPITIKISSDKLQIAQAAEFSNQPAYILLSKEILERSASEAALLGPDDIQAIVAHELGHIIPKSHATWLIGVIISAILASPLFAIVTQPLFPLVIIGLLLYWIGSVSRDEERRADSFAVVEAGIPAAQFTQSLIKADTYVSRRLRKTTTPLAFLGLSIFKLLVNTHPDIEQRVRRIRTLYGEQ